MIHFFSEEIDFNLDHHEEISSWIKTIAKNHKRKINSLNYIFCSDEYLLQINIDYLQHDTFTDIITFDNSENDEIEGDIFISTERVLENSKRLNIPFKEEFLRVVAHGILHLLGYRDKSKSDIAEMRNAENQSLCIAKNLHLL